jgi:bacillithiol biosynthesis deacetylase BshB1
MPLDLLAFAAHPDDVELTCGGTILKMTDRGYRVGVVDFTEGESGTRGNPETRRREAEAAARILGLSVRENLKLPDGGVTLDMPTKLRIVEVLRRHRPRTVILPHFEGRHPDHYWAGRAGYEACFLSGLKNFNAPGEAHRPFKVIYALGALPVAPTFVVDVTAEFERRMEAIRAYHSQVADIEGEPDIFQRNQQILDFVRREALSAGSRIGVPYGEPFLTREPVQVDDPVAMLAPSF